MGRRISTTLRLACVAGGGFLIANAIRYRRLRGTAMPLGMAGGFLIRSGIQGRMPPPDPPRLCHHRKTLPGSARAAAIGGGGVLIASAIRRHSALSAPLGAAGGVLLRSGIHGRY